MIVDRGNEEAFLYLTYERYKTDILFHVLSFDKSDYYFEDIIGLVYKALKGSDNRWGPLANFKWKCKFRTWLNKVVYNQCCHFFKGKIEVGDYPHSNVTEMNEERVREVLLYEAIARLKDDDGRFILLKIIEGYNSKEIAVLLERKRRMENRIKKRPNGEEIIPSAAYVDNYKKRCLSTIKGIINDISEEFV